VAVRKDKKGVVGHVRSIEIGKSGKRGEDEEIGRCGVGVVE